MIPGCCKVVAGRGKIIQCPLGTTPPHDAPGPSTTQSCRVQHLVCEPHMIVWWRRGLGHHMAVHQEHRIIPLGPDSIHQLVVKTAQKLKITRIRNGLGKLLILGLKAFSMSTGLQLNTKASKKKFFEAQLWIPMSNSHSRA